MNYKASVGKSGEQIAADYLKNQGYAVLDRNFKIKYPKGPWRGEIDLVAKKKGIIHFIEVKTNEIGLIASAFPPENRVGAGKRRRLIQTARMWLSLHKIPQNSKWQIDIIAVYGNNPYSIRFFENITL